LTNPVPGISIGVDLTLGHFEAAFERTAKHRDSSRAKIPHFQSQVAYYRRFLSSFFLEDLRVAKVFGGLPNSGASFEAHKISRRSDHGRQN